MELWRLTGDRTVLDELWPHALRAADAIAVLRAQRMTDAQRGQACWGLLPESISHEGYSSRPVHSFWDDFFAVLGLADAAEAAEALGDAATARRLAVLRDDMRRDLHAAIRRAIADHGLSVIPGSVELGDFDPTSTAIAFDPCDEWRRLPADALRATFDRYWDEFEARRDGTRVADAYTPYEVRTAAALVGLGQRDRALALLDWLIADQRLVAWRQWPEIAWRDVRAPRFLGDLPHGWVASSFVRTVRRLVVWEDRDAAALMLAAGIPAAWVREAPGVRVDDLPTRWGPISFAMTAPAADRRRAGLRGADRVAAGRRPHPLAARRTGAVGHGGWPPGDHRRRRGRPGRPRAADRHRALTVGFVDGPVGPCEEVTWGGPDPSGGIGGRRRAALPGRVRRACSAAPHVPGHDAFHELVEQRHHEGRVAMRRTPDHPLGNELIRTRRWDTSRRRSIAINLGPDV